MSGILTLPSRRPVAVLGALFAVCLAVFLATIPLPRVDGLLIGSDGILYYHYVHSLVIDGDLDFTNEYAHFDGPGAIPDPTPAGLPPNRVSIGTAILWLPFFLIAHGASWLLGLPTDGYTVLYQTAVCLGSMLFGFAGILATYRLCREHASPGAALCAVVLIWFAGNVVYYMVAEPSMSHMASLGAVGTFLAWWRCGKARGAASYWAGLGVLGGLAALVRPQNGLYLCLPAIEWLERGIADFRARRWRPALLHARNGLLMGAAAVCMISIQLKAWQIVYGSFRDAGYLYGSGQSFHWLCPRILQVLFSLQHGLFTWHPIYLAGAVGLWWLVGKDRAYGMLLVLAFALQVYVVASWRVWWQADAFGGRMLISTAPILAVGLAQFTGRTGRSGRTWVTVAGAGILLWNLAFFIQYRFGLIPMGDPITLRQLVWEKFTLPLKLLKRVRS